MLKLRCGTARNSKCDQTSAKFLLKILIHFSNNFSLSMPSLLLKVLLIKL